MRVVELSLDFRASHACYRVTFAVDFEKRNSPTRQTRVFLATGCTANQGVSPNETARRLRGERDDARASFGNGSEVCALPAKLIVLTDLHIVPAGETVLGIDPADRLDRALAHINHHHPDAARLVVTGDLTHYGDEESYRRLRGCLARSTLPVTLLLGNHDDRSAFRRVFPECAVDPDGFVQSAIDVASWRLVFLDSLEDDPGVTSHESHGAGRLCSARLRWLERTLADARDRPVLLFMHHPPHAVGFRGMDRIRLRDERDFFEIVRKAGNVRHIFAGHVHRTISGSVAGIPFSVFKSPVHQQPMTFDSDDTSSSVLEPPAYGIVFANGDSVLVHTEDYEFPALVPVHA